MKAFKIILKEEKVENKWGVDLKGQVKVGEVMFDYKNEDVELKKGDVVYFQDDYERKFTLNGKEYISTNPTNLICLK